MLRKIRQIRLLLSSLLLLLSLSLSPYFLDTTRQLELELDELEGPLLLY
jgi:hypothetical protein